MEKENPNQWKACFIVFDLEKQQPAVVYLENSNLGRVEMVALICETREKCRELIRKNFPKELWDRFYAGPTPGDMNDVLFQLQERLGVKHVFDGEFAYKLLELKN